MQLVTAVAEIAGVCARPLISKVTDIDSGDMRVVPIACGATGASKCKPCADKAGKLRMQQCREGWHLDHEPVPPESAPDVEDDERQADEDEDEPDRRVRSTRRRQDAPDLPRADMDPTTIGRTFTGPDGKACRPSMFITLTLPSYGRVTSEGVPVDPASYDYRRSRLSLGTAAFEPTTSASRSLPG